jgi:hypothetical protein
MSLFHLLTNVCCFVGHPRRLLLCLLCLFCLLFLRFFFSCLLKKDKHAKKPGHVFVSIYLSPYTKKT